MAEVKFNEKQLEAIEKRDTNILVSAAAGSGKTAVLVERVIRKVIDENVDIDSLIIMTFTKAAAASMRAKIYKRIREALDKDCLSAEQKDNLKVQMMKIYNANICTIDSLCMNIVKENFQEIDIDPSFRIADDAEINMIKKDILAKILEDNYQNPTQEFLEFVDSYTEKNDSKIEDIILKLYDYSQSHPEPIRWLDTCAGSYINAKNFGETENDDENLWQKKLKSIVFDKIYSLLVMCEKGIELCGENYGPYLFEENFLGVQRSLYDLKDLNFDAIGDELNKIIDSWVSLSAKRDEEIDKNKRKKAGTLYGNIKKEIISLRDCFFDKSLEDKYLDMSSCANIAKMLVDITKQFHKEFLAEKQNRFIADFSDVAHFALDVLINYDENGNRVYSKIADNIAKNTNEIIVDEYQDTNHMQEALIEALSAERFGRPNVFMVGDVKQSIYGFRMACPELFNEKRELYEKGNGGELIILDKNYRSRKEVLNITNFIFEQTMIKDIGGIDYLNNNQLVLGAEFDDCDDLKRIPEVIMVNEPKKTGLISCAYIAAKKIEELVLAGFNYSDIAIISRGSNNPELERILEDRNIPVIKSSNKGFFETFEVRLAVNLLQVIDNPYQDIPMCAVLLSPLVGMCANDLAILKNNFKNKNFNVYDALKESNDFGWFATKINEYHEKSLWMDIQEFITYMMEDSGLYNIISAMPKGDSRKANLDFIKSLCASFSKGSFVGLFNFIRYIEEIKKSDSFGQAQVEGSVDAVQMMTIHKSKGLEFPVCIVYDIGHIYNTRSLSDSILLDKELGMGIEKRDLSTRIKSNTLLMETIKYKLNVDIFAEEMRLLYVAMTRAKEKLILIGCQINMDNKIADWEDEKEKRASKFSSADVLSCNSYLSLIGQSLCHKASGTCAEYPLNKWNILKADEVEIERVDELLDNAIKKKEIEDALLVDAKPATLTFDYPFENATKTQVKVTASQLENKETNREFDLENKNFKPKKGLTGAQRGNAYHKAFEKFDFEKSAKDNVKLLLEDGFLNEEQVKSINIEDLEKFASSSLGRRMKKADEVGNLRREQQFVAKYIDGSENRLIQGIIDAFFEEDGEIVLVDYKTDKNTDENYFIETYKPQQDAYADAIEKATNKKVKEKILYLTEIGKELVL